MSPPLELISRGDLSLFLSPLYSHIEDYLHYSRRWMIKIR
jgi:hypothetical protein